MARRQKRINRSPAGDVIMAIILGLFSLFFLFPLIYSIGNSLKPLNELWHFPPLFVPHHPTFKNYVNLALAATSMWVPLSRYLFNTVLITGAGVVGQVIFASLCSYAISLHKFPGAKLTNQIITLAMMFNATVIAVPVYLVGAKLGLIDTYWIMFLPSCGGALGLYLINSFMGQIPMSIIEAARVDGATHWQTFIKIVMPQVKPAWLTMTIFQVNLLWGMQSNSSIYSEQLKPIGFLLQSLGSDGSLGRSGVTSAVAVVMMIIPVLVFVISQSNIIETMSTSGLKE